MITKAQPHHLKAIVALGTLTSGLSLLTACDDDVSAPTLIGGGLSYPRQDQGPSAPQTGADEVDMTLSLSDQSPPPERLDMAPPTGGMATGGMATGGAESGGIEGGVSVTLMSCDPRLRAQSCEEGYSCWQRADGEPYQGECVSGDGCDLLNQTGCPTSAPLCQLDGRAARCVPSPEPPLMEGSPCLTEANGAQPCAVGLVCNLSVCVPTCDPSGAGASCADARPCVDLTERVGQAVGYCGFHGQCDLFTGTGCAAQESCRFALRPDDLRLVTFCVPEGTALEGEACLENGEGAQGCSTGFTCIGSGNGLATCRRICDTGAYVAACPVNQACREILSVGPNLPIRGVGLCVTNP